MDQRKPAARDRARGDISMIATLLIFLVLALAFFQFTRLL